VILRNLLYPFLLFSFCVFSQELPPIQNFTPLEYEGENQNWGITQGLDAHIYIANNHNLLEYDGVRWNKYESPNASVFRSVSAKDSLIFTGQYLDFGYWKKDSFGDLKYTSISAKLNEPMLEDEEFWNIVTLGDWVLFQSLDRIYSYNIKTNQFKVLEAKSTKANIFKVEDGIYFQNQNLGIYKIENGEPNLVLSHEAIDGRSVVGMYKDEDGILIILDNAKFLKIQEKSTVLWPIEADYELDGINVFCSNRLNDGSFVLGTISKGIYHIGKSGKFLRVINQRKGLNNNTVLSVFQDKDDNLWLGLDNGLSVINIKSPFNEYVDNLGRLGLVYTSKLYDGNLYLGTNQGLFIKPENSDDDFKMIVGTDGQVWSLKEINGTLFCGHNSGTFIVNQNNAQLISTLPGTWDIKTIEGNPNMVLQGNYDGLSTLKKENGNWVFGNKISGFNIASRFFEVLNDRQVLVNHEYKGLYELTIDSSFSKVVNSKSHPIMGHGSSILNYQDNIVYTSLDASFRKIKDSLSFKPDTTLIRLLFKETGGVTSIMMPDGDADRFWCFTQSGLTYVYPSTFNATLGSKTIPIPAFFRRSLGVSGFENLTKIREEQYLIGISNGFVVLDIDKAKETSYNVKINQVTNHNGIETPIKLPLLPDQELGYDQNSVSFYYGVSQYDKYSEVSYQSRLIGQYEDWSPWTTASDISFNSLKYGDYKFEVRARVGNSLSKNTSEYSFVIKRPWYWSVSAIIVYSLVLAAIFFGVHRLYKSYYTAKQNRLLNLEKKKLKRKKLKTQKELAQIKNEKLKSEIEGKNRELAVATMSMIKKNKFLSTIKEQLSQLDSTSNIKAVIKTIDKNISNEDDWKFFQEAFNNADKDFLKKVKVLHPELTANDLRLCAYLRLNLSSKEIAPLLNISVRSVEVKRYRLRKKMNLDHESGLTTYILNL
jgi:DNA-binding CsgD family transcriptional regulator